MISLGIPGLGQLEFAFQQRSEVCGRGSLVVMFEVCFQTYHVLVHVGHAWREGILVWEQEK